MTFILTVGLYLGCNRRRVTYLKVTQFIKSHRFITGCVINTCFKFHHLSQEDDLKAGAAVWIMRSEQKVSVCSAPWNIDFAVINSCDLRQPFMMMTLKAQVSLKKAAGVWYSPHTCIRAYGVPSIRLTGRTKGARVNEELGSVMALSISERCGDEKQIQNGAV